MSTAITFPKDNDLSGLRLEQGPTGHIYSPWFSFPHDVIMERGRDTVDYSGRGYQMIKAAAVSAFCNLLGIEPLDVVVTEMNDPSDIVDGRRWRLSTRYPKKLPTPKPAPKPVLPENRGAIDI